MRYFTIITGKPLKPLFDPHDAHLKHKGVIRLAADPALDKVLDRERLVAYWEDL